MKPHRRVLWLAMLLLLGAALVNPAAAAPLGGDLTIEQLPFYIFRLRTQYVEPVDTAVLANGVLRGFKAYLDTQRQSSTFLPDRIAEDMTADAQIEQAQTAYRAVLAKIPGLDRNQLLYAGLRGMVQALDDPYTIFMDPSEYGTFEENMTGHFGGVGISIMPNDDLHRPVIVEVLEGMPAEAAGIKAQDVLMAIDGVSTDNMALDDASRRIRGVLGTTVVFTVRRPGEQKDRDFTIVRADIMVKSVKVKMLNDRIGYIALTGFNRTTAAEMDDALTGLEDRHAQAYILDLRNNPGGYIDTAVDVCGDFLDPKTLVVSVKTRGRPAERYSTRYSLHPHTPLVVLVNANSASASEITAGAFQDLGRAILVGTKTYGKGSVQQVMPLPGGSAVKFTIAKYQTPHGRFIDKIGLTPEVVVDMKPLDMGGPHDTQLAKALEVINNLLARGPLVPAGK